MRLKILFFPIILVVVIYVSIAFTWPEYEASAQARADLGQKQQSLNEVRAKRANIDSLKNSLNQNQENEKIIKTYLPAVTQEEKIINAIDRIATSAGVSLGALSVASSQPKAVQASPVIAEDNSPSLLGSVGKTDNIAAGADVLPEVNAELLFTDSSISVIGEYGYIKDFIDQLNRIGVYSTIESVSISKQDPKATALSAQITAKFGHLTKFKHKRSLGNKLDFSVANDIAKLVAGTPEAPKAETVGTVNPFLP